MRRALPYGGAAALCATAICGLAGGTVMAPTEAAAQCSVFSRHPCAFGSYPHYYPCGLHVSPGCMSNELLPLNQVPVIHVTGHAGPPEPVDRDKPANRLDEMGPILSKCLQLPPDDEAHTGMRVTLKLAFKRDGELLGEPRFTYISHDAPADVKAAYHHAAMAMLERCMPLPVTERLGRAIAGRPFVIPIVETRTENHAGRPADQPKPDDTPPGVKP